MYDVIVIGARVAGSPTAMLLAQKGYKVLLVDRASFPSDTLSTHQVQLKGGAALKRWGLLNNVLASNCPPIKQLSFHVDRFHFQGEYHPLEGLNTVICPRRTVLDTILVNAASGAGVEVRQDLIAEDLTQEDGRVNGIRGRVKSGQSGASIYVEEKARLVVGADGKHSLVASSVKPAEYKVKPTLTCGYYTYWEGLDLEVGELYTLPKSVVGVWPTNDGLAVIYTAYPVGEFQAIRSNIESRFWMTLESSTALAERFRSGKQADRFYGAVDLPAYYRRPYGPGWALVGDSGMTLDPITGQGIGNALVDAERLADALDAGFSGRSSLEAALEVYESKRNADTLPMYEFTANLAAFEPPGVEQEILFSALEKNPEAIRRFFGALTGSVRLPDFFSASNLLRTIGIAGMSRIIMNRIRFPRHKPQEIPVQDDSAKVVNSKTGI